MEPFNPPEDPTPDPAAPPTEEDPVAQTQSADVPALVPTNRLRVATGQTTDVLTYHDEDDKPNHIGHDYVEVPEADVDYVLEQASLAAVRVEREYREVSS